MELLLVFGWIVLMGLLILAPLIVMAVIRKWTMLISQIVQRLEYSSWKPLLGHQLLLLFPIIIAFIILDVKQQYLAGSFGSLFLAILQITFHPLWILISTIGFWIIRNFHDSSPNNLRRERLFIAVGMSAYILIAASFVLLPVTLVEDLRVNFLFLTPLNSLLGFTFLRASPQQDPNKRRPLKWIARDIAIVYALALVIFAFPPLFSD